MNTLGIDFGTSNSLAAIIVNGNLELVEFDGAKSTPTVLFFPAISLLKKSNRDYEFGNKAIEAKYGEDEIGRLVFSFKGLLADTSFDSTAIPVFGSFTAERFCSYFLQKLKDTAEKQFKTSFDSVILGRPVEFDSIATEKLERAAKSAGFEKVYFQLEPIAAAMSYERTLTESDGEQTILVCDIGGGTSDYAVIKVSSIKSLQNDRSSDILSIGGIYQAGESFNAAIVTEYLPQKFGKGAKWGSDKTRELPIHLVRALGNWKTLPFLRKENIRNFIADIESSRKEDVQRLVDLVENNWGHRLYEQVDKAKISLSNNEVSRIEFRTINLDEEINRSTFESLITPILNNMESEIINTLIRADKLPEDIDKVILTGGSSLSPIILAQIISLFGQDKIIPIDAFNSVVAGLAIEAEKYST